MAETRLTRSLTALVAFAFVGSSTAPLIAQPKRGVPVSVADDQSPVRCRRGAEDDPRIYGSHIPRSSGGIATAPPPSPPSSSPPPPPPPPPPPSQTSANDGIVVTAQRVEQQLQSVPIAVTAVSSETLSKSKRGARVPAVKSVAPYPMPAPYPAPQDRERYSGKDVASIKAVTNDPVSTFSVDVDTGSYANVRRFLTQGQVPPVASVRTEEMLNYFRYDYAVPRDRSRPFSVTTDMARTPWNAETRLLRIGIKGYDLPRSERPAANLVFLVDVSGSMMDQDKLPLVKTSLSMLADRLSPQDRVSIVVYAGAAGIVLDPTSRPAYVKQALDCLQAGGSTAGGQGMELAYATAKANFIKGGVNRVIMATDGDFNVGISSNDGIEAIVKKHREDGITLTTLGFGQGNYNEAMMERIADIGNGNYSYIDSAIEAQKVLDDEMAATIFTIAKDVKIQIEFNPAAVREYRLIGYENRILAEEDFNNDKVDAGDIGAGHQVTALYEIVPVSARGWLPDRRYEANRKPSQSTKPAGEMAWLKLRYKLPDGNKSMLIETPVAASLIASAEAPRGDMAFATSVAAFGQKLRGDKYLGDMSYSDIRRLAGDQRGYLREEFLKLTSLADSGRKVARAE